MPRQEPLVARGLAEQVYDRLHSRVLAHELEPGEKLVIDRLARDLGVSVTPVRDALRRLAAERLIDFAPYRGFSVLPEPTREQVAQSFEARRAIEPFAAGLGAQRASDEEIERLADIHLQLSTVNFTQEPENLQRFVRLNQMFHEAIVASAANPVLLDAFRSLYHEPLVGRTQHGFGVPDIAEIAEEHGAIVAAFRARDSEAAAAQTARHVVDGGERMLAAMGPAPRPA